jgi:hypothetical protein
MTAKKMVSAKIAENKKKILKIEFVISVITLQFLKENAGAKIIRY